MPITSRDAWSDVPNLLLFGGKALTESVKTSLQPAKPLVEMCLAEHKDGDWASGSGSLVVMSTDWPKIERGRSPYGARRDHTTYSFSGRAGAGPGL